MAGSFFCDTTVLKRCGLSHKMGLMVGDDTSILIRIRGVESCDLILRWPFSSGKEDLIDQINSSVMQAWWEFNYLVESVIN